MKVSLNWLTDYVDVSALPVGKLRDALTYVGLCCDSVEETDTDVVLVLEITSNRPDCLGHIGIARELSAVLDLPLKLPDLGLTESPPPAGELTSVEVHDPDLCPRYTARLIRNVKVGPSPRWMVERLDAVGLRSINNVVDVTNYVMLEYSQPLHSFDYDLLDGRRIVVRRARTGESIVSIDGTRCNLTDKMLVIADAAKPVAVAGIMGGMESEINDKTSNILLEAAQFDPLTTRNTARTLALMSESSYRFERGVDPVGVELASRRACRLIQQLGGGQLAQGVVDVWAKPFAPPTVVMRTDRCRSLLGYDADDQTQAAILRRLGLGGELAGGKVTCVIPAYRRDLQREADLIEEVARLNGYDKIPVHDKVTHRVTGKSLVEQVRHDLHDVMSAAGFDEAVTHSFVDDAESELFGIRGGYRVDPRVRKTNNLLRASLLPALLRGCKTNQDAGDQDVSLYELSAVFPARSANPTPDEMPAEYTQLGLASGGDLPALRGVVEALAAHVAPDAALSVTPQDAPGFVAGASAVIVIDTQPAGQIGLAAQAVLDYYGLEKPHALATLRFDSLMGRAGRTKMFKPLPKFPAVRRDLSVVVDEATTWRQVADAVRSANQPELVDVEYVGVYRGKQVSAGKKSVTLTLTYRSEAGTLRGEQVDQNVSVVAAALAAKLGAQLRA